MAHSYVGQDVRHQSFRGKDLVDADFTGADLRGCDFREAILTGGDFTGVTTGQSYKQFIYLIVVAVAVAFMGMVIGLGASLGLFLGAIVGDALGAIVGTVLGAVLGAVLSGIVVTLVSFLTAFISRVTGGPGIVSLDTVMFESTFAVVGNVGITVLIAIQAYNSFLIGNISLGILCITASLIFITITWFYFKELLKTLKSSISTYFNGADLTGANFANAELQFTDFTDANCNLVNWQGVKFYHCKLPKSIENAQVRYLCKNPEKGRAGNYTSSNFHKAYLQNVDLVDAILRNTNFNGADLRGAKLINADLSNSQALGTDFSGATLTGARIANWGINPETKFENVICTYVYIDDAGKERKPASGEFKDGDFAILVTKFTKTLDFLFKNGIQPQAFDQALQEMLDRYGEFGIQLQAVESVGDGDRSVSFEVQDPDADKGKIHADFESKYYGVIRQLEEAQTKVQELQQAKIEISTKLAVVEALKQEKEKQSLFLQDFVYHQTDRFSRPSFHASHSTFSGDPMSDKNQNISLNAGGSMTGITVAGGDISGTVTLTIQQLRDSDTPEAPKLADLLTDLQKAISESNELAEPDKEKALKYLDKIGKLANDKEADRDMIGMAIDGILNVVSKAAKLLTPVQAIAYGLRKLLQL